LLIIALTKGVPSRTTQVVQVGGVLNREALDLVLNPHDSKGIQAADYVKRRVGGKTVAISMGPDMRLVPIMKPLFDAEVHGVDEEYILSDRKMAGSDTLATSYAVSLGVKKLLDIHLKAIDELAESVKKSGYSDAVRSKASDLYRRNLLPNEVYTELPAVRDSIVERFLKGSATASETVSALLSVKEGLSRFLIVAGVKTTDGETGSVGPQVAEGVSEILGSVMPHATYVEDFEINPEGSLLTAERKIGYISQKLEMNLPCLLTISSEYRPREPVASGQFRVRRNSFRGKITVPTRWTAEDLGADPKRLGLAGSPTIVGAGIDLGGAPVQKEVGKSLVFAKRFEKFEFEGKSYGPFERSDLVGALPEDLVSDLRTRGVVGLFGYDILVGELFD